MNTTTMIEKLRTKATDYEHKALGLRLAAHELELELTMNKHSQLGQQLQAAVKVRREQRPQLRPKQHATPTDTEARLNLIRTALADGPKTTKDLMRVLQAAGAQIGHDRVRQLLHEHMGSEVRRSGGAARSRWALKAHRLSSNEKRSRDRDRKRQARSARHVPPRGTRPPRARNPDAALTKARTVATILKEHGKAMAIKELSQAARERGLTNGLTGIANFIKRGFIKHNGKGYSFVAMPPEQTAATPA